MHEILWRVSWFFLHFLNLDRSVVWHDGARAVSTQCRLANGWEAIEMGSGVIQKERIRHSTVLAALFLGLHKGLAWHVHEGDAVINQDGTHR